MQTLANQIITTERLILKPTGIAHAAFMYALLNSDTWLQYIGDRNVHSIAEAQQYIENRILPAVKQAPICSYIVYTKENDVALGTVGLYKREELDTPDLGFAFLPEHTGKGYAYEAAQALLAMAFTNPKLKELYAITTEDNYASQRLLQKLGFRFNRMQYMEKDKESLMLFIVKNTR